MRAAHIGHEVVVFHVLTRDEVELPFRGDVELEDPETGATGAVERRGRAARPYRAAIRAFLERWRTRCATYGIDYVRVFTDTPLDAGAARLPAPPRAGGVSVMIWQAPAAFAGLAALPAPCSSICWRAGMRGGWSFPATRFVRRCRPRPSGCSGRPISGCCCLRLAIVTAAVARARRSPLLMTPWRQRAWNSRVARAVVVDTSPQRGGSRSPAARGRRRSGACSRRRRFTSPDVA